MYFGEKVRDRHYALFAAWLDEQYKFVADRKRTTIKWKVNGTTDLFDAKL